RSLIQTKGKDDRLDGAAVREQFDHQRDLVCALSQAVEDRPSGGAETLITLVANVAAVFLRMYANIVFPNLFSGRTIEVGTKCGFWGQWRFFFLTSHKEKRRLTSDFFSMIYQATVKCRATDVCRVLIFFSKKSEQERCLSLLA